MREKVREKILLDSDTFKRSLRMIFIFRYALCAIINPVICSEAISSIPNQLLIIFPILYYVRVTRGRRLRVALYLILGTLYPIEHT